MAIRIHDRPKLCLTSHRYFAGSRCTSQVIASHRWLGRIFVHFARHRRTSQVIAGLGRIFARHRWTSQVIAVAGHHTYRYFFDIAVSSLGHPGPVELNNLSQAALFNSQNIYPYGGVDIQHYRKSSAYTKHSGLLIILTCTLI